MSSFKYKPTTSLYKIKKMFGNKNSVYVIQGGQGAGKTISVLMLIIDYAVRNDKKKISIVSDELSKMKRTIIKDFLDIIKDYNVYEMGVWNISNSIFTLPNGTFIEFLGLDSHDIGKGMRRDLVYFNEANKMKIEGYRQIASRSKLNIIDFNPDKFFWGHELITDTNFINLTFRDNEYLSEQEVASILEYKEKGYNEDGSIKSDYWANIWKVYGLGEIGSVIGVIFGFELGEFVEPEYGLVYGCDVGYTHPTAVVKVHLDKKKSIIYLKEVFYDVGKTSSEIYDSIKDEVKDTRIWVDSAAPMFIKELKDKGLNTKAVIKPKIKDRIISAMDYKIIIDPTSKNLINEMGLYQWSDNEKKEEPIDANNHAIDAWQYAFVHKVKERVAQPL